MALTAGTSEAGLLWLYMGKDVVFVLNTLILNPPGQERFSKSVFSDFQNHNTTVDFFEKSDKSRLVKSQNFEEWGAALFKTNTKVPELKNHLRKKWKNMDFFS